MAGSQIGPLTAKVVANSESLQGDLQQAEGKLKAGLNKMGASAREAGDKAGKGWAQGLANGITSLSGKGLNLGKGLGGWAQGAMTNPLKGLTDGLSTVADLTTRIPALGPLLALPLAGAAAAGAGALALYERGAERINVFAESAQKANMSLREFTVLSETFGGDPKDLTEGLVKFQMALQRGADTALGAKDVFADLGLDRLALQGMGGAEAFGAFSDAVRGLGSRFAQLAALQPVFGESGGKFLPGIMKGSAGLERTRGLLSTFGADFDEGNVAALRKSAEAKREIGLAWKGLETQFAIGLSPVFAGIAETLPRLSELGITAAGLGETIKTIGTNTVLWLAGAADSLKALWNDPLTFLQEKWGEFSGWLAEKGRSLGEVLGDAIGRGVRQHLPSWLLPADDGEGEIVLPRVRERVAAKEAADRKARQWDVRPLIQGGLGSLGDAMGRLPGLDAALRKAGFGNTFLDQTLAAFDKVNQKMEEAARLGVATNPFAPWEASLKGLAGQFQSPLDKIKNELDDFLKRTKVPEAPVFDAGGGMLGGGIQGIPMMAPVLGARGAGVLDKLRGEFGAGLLGRLRGMAGAEPAPFTGAAEAGSREAFSAITAFDAATKTGGGQSLQDQIEALLKQLEKEEAERRAEGRAALQALEKIKENTDALKVGGEP